MLHDLGLDAIEEITRYRDLAAPDGHIRLGNGGELVLRLRADVRRLLGRQAVRQRSNYLSNLKRSHRLDVCHVSGLPA